MEPPPAATAPSCLVLALGIEVCDQCLPLPPSHPNEANSQSDERATSDHKQKRREVPSRAQRCIGGRCTGDAQGAQIDQQHRGGAMAYHQEVAIPVDAEAKLPQVGTRDDPVQIDAMCRPCDGVERVHEGRGTGPSYSVYAQRPSALIARLNGLPRIFSPGSSGSMIGFAIRRP